MAVEEALHRRERDRRLFLLVAILFPLVVIIGFARSYYLKGLFGTQALPSFLVHVHGAVMTSWVLLFVGQIWLVRSRRTRTHQRLGMLGAILAVLVVVVGVITARAAAARGAAPDGPSPLSFLAVPLVDMLVFSMLVGAAFYYRRRLDIHKRLMLLASMALVTAAIARIPLHFIATGGPLVFFGLTDLCVFACIAVDTIQNRRLHPAFVWGSIIFVLSQPLRLMLAGTDLWLRFAAWFVG